MKRAPLLIPAVAFVGAIAADAYGWSAVVAACVVVLAWRARTRLVAAFACAGLIAGVVRGHPAIFTAESRTERFAVTVTGDVRPDPFGGSTFDARLENGPTVRVHVRGTRVEPGERLVVRGRLVPFDEARNPGEPSRRAIALGEGIAGELNGDRVLARAPPTPLDVRTWPGRARAVLSARLRRIVRQPEATVLAGALWGERGTLPRDLRDDFQATGTVHVLVTAGLHLGIVAALVLGLLRLAAIPRVPASLAAIPCVVGYAWLSGAHLPSQRAAVMVTLALVARACGARLFSWNALAAAALAVAALWPASVSTVSFALSFSCVAAIGLYARTLQRLLERLAAPERVREALALTIATQIGVWPLSAATFGLVAPYAVLANAVVVPATALGMVAAIGALALDAMTSAFGTTASALVRAAATLATYDIDVILRVVTTVASLPGARIEVPAPPAPAIVGYDAAAVLAAAMLRDTPRIAALTLAFASAAVLATTIRLPDGRLRITMLDVGQGDGIVIRTPRGHVVLIDTGGRLERGPGEAGESAAELVGERIVLAYLKRQGIRRVDLLVNTHPHGDHVGGFAPIVRAMPVDAVADSGQRYGGRAFNDGLREAALHHVPVRIVRCGDRWSSDDGVTIAVLSPCGALFTDGNNDVNENSVVAMLVYGGFRMLFMGDAGFQSEHRLLASGIDLHAEVLKVGHHGSAYSSSADFVGAVRPRYALVSVGRHNTFGHPAAMTLATLQSVGATVARTDRCGAIVVETGAPSRIATTLRC